MSSDHSHAHAHGGHHHHHGGGDHDFAQANADHFDKMVDEYENIPGAHELMNHVGRALRATGAFDKESTTVLDFACGIGMLSREIFPVCKSIVGVDISKGSVEAYNRTAVTQGVLPEGMHAIALDILKEGPNALEGQKFDVVVCSMAYHHFEHPDQISRVLANYLKPNGKLFVLDFSTGHPMHKAEHRQALKGELEHVVPHLDGFSEEVMRTMFVDGAGLDAFGYADVCRVPAPMPREMAEKFTDEERMIDVFLAEGTKSA